MPVSGCRPTSEAGAARPAVTQDRLQNKSADPVTPGNIRFFAVNANGLIYEHNASLYADMPDVGPPPFGHSLR